MPTATISKDFLAVGKYYVPKIPLGMKLYWNDNGHRGVEIEEYFNDSTVYQGEVASGELDGSKPVRISDLLQLSTGHIQIEATKIGGVQQAISTAAISLDLFERYFIPAAFPPT